MPAAKKSPRSIGQSQKDLRRRAQLIFRRLEKLYPDARCALTHEDPYQLLAATILSAQCTDERVNQVTPILFARYPSPAHLANAEIAELESIIRSTGFYHNKAKALIASCRAIVERYAGRVPDTMADLLTLHGVARKTANVVLGNAHGRSEGVVVDTHVGRLAVRMGLTQRRDKDAVNIEKDLMQLFDPDQWTLLAHLLIFHGRQVCSARKPACDRCKLADICPKKGVSKNV